MYNSYHYIDSDYIYTNPQTGLLRNKVNIIDKDLLLFVESGAVTKRLKELSEKPIKIKTIENLFEIHKYLFQDIYSWAGEKRIVEISKDGKQFFPTSHFKNAFIFIDTLICDYKMIEKSDKTSITNKLAEILDNINFLHPFREGNGRAQREFIRSLALEKGIKLNLNPLDNSNVYDLYMKGTINSDVKILSSLIFNLIKE